MSFQDAVQQFQENIDLNGGVEALSHTDPEKYNLYAGLMSLAEGLQELQTQVQALQTAINQY